MRKWSPADSVQTIASMAAMPDENAMPCCAPSSVATFPSQAFRVGLSPRAYS